MGFLKVYSNFLKKLIINSSSFFIMCESIIQKSYEVRVVANHLLQFFRSFFNRFELLSNLNKLPLELKTKLIEIEFRASFDLSIHPRQQSLNFFQHVFKALSLLSRTVLREGLIAGDMFFDPFDEVFDEFLVAATFLEPDSIAFDLPL
jgi:hypothetical protein